MPVKAICVLKGDGGVTGTVTLTQDVSLYFSLLDCVTVRLQLSKSIVTERSVAIQLIAIHLVCFAGYCFLCWAVAVSRQFVISKLRNGGIYGLLYDVAHLTSANLF